MGHVFSGTEATLIEKMLGAAPLVILITHLKDHRIGKIKTGKQIPDAQRTLEEKASLRLWLRHNPDSPKPIGLVLKRIEKWKLDENGLEAICVLPRRINPCTWQKIQQVPGTILSEIVTRLPMNGPMNLNCLSSMAP